MAASERRSPWNTHHSHENDAQIQPQRGIADVPLVERIFLLGAQQFAAVDLSPAGDSWANRQSNGGVGGLIARQQAVGDRSETCPRQAR